MYYSFAFAEISVLESGKSVTGSPSILRVPGGGVNQVKMLKT